MIKRFWNSRFLLLLILLLAIFLRVYNIPQTLLFHFDQGYHGLAIREIWENKRIALLGHKTDVEGIFHGSFFYYFMLPLYLVSGWNPAGVSTILAALDGLTVIFIYLLGKELFGRQIGLLAALFYAVSYSLISYSRWLSNVTPIPFFSTLFFYFLVRTVQGEIKYLPISGLFLGIVAQLNGAIGFFLIPSFLFGLVTVWQKLLTKLKILLLTIALLFLPALPLVIFDFRHQFLVSRSIFGMFSVDKGMVFGTERIFSHLALLRNEFTSLVTYQFPLLFGLLSFLIAVAVLRVWRKIQLLLFLLFLPIFTLIFYPGGIHQFFFIGILPLLVLLISWSLVYWWQKKLFRPAIAALVIILMMINLFHWQGFLKPGFNLIPIGTRNLITLEDRLRALDFIYQRAQGKPFQTPIYIIPYNQEQPWDYVFSWYGKTKYGYLPNKYLGKTFVIFEPDYDFPYRLESWLGKIEGDHGGVVAEFKTHDLTAQERER